MKKVLVIGSPGSGKSVFSVRLGKITGLPVVHLDRHYWRSGWIEPSRDLWDSQLDELLNRDSWIIDGNYSRTMERRLASCDTAIFLDFPRHICTWRVAKRFLRYRGRSSPDLPAGCPEKIDLEFLKWTWTYPERSRINVLKKLETAAERISIVTLTTNQELEEYLVSKGPSNKNGN